MTFAAKLAALRKAKELTQPELAAAADVPLWTLRKYEQGQIVKVPFPAVVALAKALGASCEAFAGCELRPPEDGDATTASVP